MSSKSYKPTWRISFDNQDIEMYPFRVIISMLEGKCGVLKITEKFDNKQTTHTFDVERLGFGFPEDPVGPIRILDRSTGNPLFALRPMYCTCVKEITKARNWLDGETMLTSKYIFTQVNHRVNNLDQYKFTSLVTFIPSTKS